MLRNWKVWAGFGVSAFALWFTLRNVDFGQLGSALVSADGAWLVPALLLFVVSFTARAWRWSLLMGGSPFWITLHAMNIGYLMNILLPLRLGEVGRCYVIGERTPVPMASAFSSIVVERVLDLATVVALFVLLAARVPMPPAFARAAAIGGALVLLVLVAGGLLVWQSARGERLLGALLGRVTRAPEPWLRRFRELCLGFRAVGSARRVLLVLALTLVVWATAILVAWCTLAAFLPPSLLEAGLTTVIANLGGALPSAPGGLGIVQAFAASALVIPFHVPEDRALAFAFVWSLGQQLVLIGLGLFGLGRIGMSFADVRGGRRAPAPKSTLT